MRQISDDLEGRKFNASNQKELLNVFTTILEIITEKWLTSQYIIIIISYIYKWLLDSLNL